MTIWLWCTLVGLILLLLAGAGLTLFILVDGWLHPWEHEPNPEEVDRG